MSLWNVLNLSQKITRQAYILANSRIVVSTQKLPANVNLRSAHNSLYYMVKKRTLEARSKLQANKYPNHQACMTAKTVPCPSEPIESDCNASQTVFASKQDDFSQKAPGRRPESVDNTEVVGATSGAANNKSTDNEPVIDKCNTKRDPCAEFMSKYGKDRGPGSGGKGGMGGAGGGGGAGGDDGKSGSGGDDKGGLAGILNWKCLLGILLALGTGGLIAWLLMRDKDKGEKGGAGDSDDDKLKRAQFAGLITVPASSADLPKHVPYLLIGGGTAAFSAFRAIKSNDATAKVLIISNEFRKPYMRPPLSKELWYTAVEKIESEKPVDYRFKQWTGAERSLYFEPDEFFVDPAKLMDNVNGGIAVAQGFSVKKIDPFTRTVTLNDGYELTYDECLIATGCEPKNLVMFKNAGPAVREKVMVYRTPDDYDRLRRYAKEKRTITIVGNGFIGSELACSLAHFSKQNGGGKVYQVFPETGNMSKVLPNYLSRWTMMKMEALGVTVIPNSSVKSAFRDDEQLQLELNNGSTLLTDVVVVCVGCTPNTILANDSNLEVDRALGGFVVNAELEARRNLYVAGDASCFYDPLLGRRRVEHHDHSVVSGRLAGENMTGKKKPYTHQSMFWSDLGPEIGYEGIGLVDSSLPTVGVFALPTASDRTSDNLTEVATSGIEESEPPPNENSTTTTTEESSPPMKCDPNDEANYGKGVIFYLKNDKIVGILLWNLFNRIGLARTIINQDKKYEDLNEVAKLFEIHA